MRAAVLHTPGEPPRLAEHPDPTAGAGRTLVRVTAAPLVPLDLLCASGTSYFGRPAVPYVPGVQGVGVVETSTALAAGTRVWFATSAGMAPGDGSHAERCAVPDDDLVPLDTAVPDPLVAALGLSAVAAWMSLTWRARLAPGERVVVLGGGGAVGQVGIGAAQALGAGRVVAVARSEGALDRARAAGADAVVPLAGRCRRSGRRAARGPGRPGGRGAGPRVRRGRDGGVAGPRGRRAPGEPRRRVRRRGGLLLRRPARPLGQRPGLHQQRDHARASAARPSPPCWSTSRPAGSR